MKKSLSVRHFCENHSLRGVERSASLFLRSMNKMQKTALGHTERVNEWCVRSLLLLHGSHHNGFHRSINSGGSLLLLLLAGNECGGGKSENGDVLHIGCLSWLLIR